MDKGFIFFGGGGLGGRELGGTIKIVYAYHDVENRSRHEERYKPNGQYDLLRVAGRTPGTRLHRVNNDDVSDDDKKRTISGSPAHSRAGGGTARPRNELISLRRPTPNGGKISPRAH